MTGPDRPLRDRSQQAHVGERDPAAALAIGDRLERVVRSTSVRSGYVSLIGHLVLAMLLAILAVQPPETTRLQPLVLGFDGNAPQLEAAFQLAADPSLNAGTDQEARDTEAEPEQPPPEGEPSQTAVADAANDASMPDEPAADPQAEPSLDPSQTELLAETPSATTSDRNATSEPVQPVTAGPLFTAVSSSQSSLPSRPPQARSSGVTGGVSGVPFANRSGATKREAVRQHGGTAASEEAVTRGLDWLAAHQGPDGSWRCDLANSRCRGACRHPGSITGSIGPTALALLPFLGSGSTHLDGPHQQTVSRGLYHLATSIRPTPRGGDLCEGSMYAHGIAVLAMAEAFGMTHDDFLEPLLQETVRFTETSQDLHGGGWRYLPGQAGDTTVTGWQVVGLKSAAMAGIPVRSPTLDGVRRFLDSVQTQGGAAYGYRTPAAKPSTSAVGLLARMYTGWTTADEPLQRGMTQLAARGPDPNAIYENFYLAQVLMQADHPVWPRWNAANRDQIIRQQATHGHEAGSWFFADPDSAPGGRLAHTALAILSLEVYYRLLPIYQDEAVDGTF
jgi:hypothetical protein